MALKKPKLVPQVTTLWDYPSQHYGDREQGSKDYRGATPSYVIWNVLHRFTQPGERVLDPFCGSGTTLVAAAKAGRRAIGIDVGELAIETTSARLEREGVAFERL